MVTLLPVQVELALAACLRGRLHGGQQGRAGVLGLRFRLAYCASCRTSKPSAGRPHCAMQRQPVHRCRVRGAQFVAAEARAALDVAIAGRLHELMAQGIIETEGRAQVALGLQPVMMAGILGHNGSEYAQTERRQNRRGFTLRSVTYSANLMADRSGHAGRTCSSPCGQILASAAMS